MFVGLLEVLDSITLIFSERSKSPQLIGGPINLAAGEEVSIKELVEMIAQLTRSRSPLEIGALPYRPTEIWRMFEDGTMAREVLGWTPKILLEEGLLKTIDWYRAYLATV